MRRQRAPPAWPCSWRARRRAACPTRAERSWLALAAPHYSTAAALPARGTRCTAPSAEAEPRHATSGRVRAREKHARHTTLNERLSIASTTPRLRSAPLALRSLRSVPSHTSSMRKARYITRKNHGQNRYMQTDIIVCLFVCEIRVFYEVKSSDEPVGELLFSSTWK